MSSPCLIRLAIVSILMAAKLEEPMQPSFARMVTLVKNEWDFTLEKAELVELERQVMIVLNGDLLTVTPIFFLERFQRLFGVD